MSKNSRENNNRQYHLATLDIEKRNLLNYLNVVLEEVGSAFSPVTSYSLGISELEVGGVNYQLKLNGVRGYIVSTSTGVGRENYETRILSSTGVTNTGGLEVLVRDSFYVDLLKKVALALVSLDGNGNNNGTYRVTYGK